jgi:GxxExxY protein
MDMQDFRERAYSGVDPHVEDLAHAVIGAAIEVHRELGPGLPEISYRRALSHELSLRAIPHRSEAPVAIIYKGILVGEGYVDILVDEQLVVEIKVVEALHEVHRAQAIAYLQALKLKLALLINFNVEMLRNGIKRVIRKTD